MRRISRSHRRMSLAGIAAALLAAAAVAPAAQVDQASATPPSSGSAQVATIEELDEIVVRGKRLSQAIEEAEDEFFKLFNELNKDHRYDTNCVRLRLDSDSRLESRACIPAFVADAMAAWAPFKARCQPPMDGFDEFDCLDRNDDRRLSRAEASARVELDGDFSVLDENQDNYIDRDEFPQDMAFEATYMPPAPDLVLMNGSKDWYDHMMKVTNSDPRLQRMADHLGGLYQELGETQRRFIEVDAALKKKVELGSVGPRAR